jgi:hypothetical protein
VTFVERHQHIGVLPADVVALDEGEVVRDRNADVVVDDPEVPRTDDVANQLLDLRDDVLGLLDARADRRAYVKTHLPGVDLGEEVHPDRPG